MRSGCSLELLLLLVQAKSKIITGGATQNGSMFNRLLHRPLCNCLSHLWRLICNCKTVTFINDGRFAMTMVVVSVDGGVGWYEAPDWVKSLYCSCGMWFILFGIGSQHLRTAASLLDRPQPVSRKTSEGSVKNFFCLTTRS